MSLYGTQSTLPLYIAMWIPFASKFCDLSFDKVVLKNLNWLAILLAYSCYRLVKRYSYFSRSIASIYIQVILLSLLLQICCLPCMHAAVLLWYQATIIFAWFHASSRLLFQLFNLGGKDSLSLLAKLIHFYPYVEFHCILEIEVLFLQFSDFQNAMESGWMTRPIWVTWITFFLVQAGLMHPDTLYYLDVTRIFNTPRSCMCVFFRKRHCHLISNSTLGLVNALNLLHHQCETSCVASTSSCFEAHGIPRFTLQNSVLWDQFSILPRTKKSMVLFRIPDYFMSFYII